MVVSGPRNEGSRAEFGLSVKETQEKKKGGGERRAVEGPSPRAGGGGGARIARRRGSGLEDQEAEEIIGNCGGEEHAVEAVHYPPVSGD